MEDREIISLFYKREGRAVDETDKKYGRNCRCISYDIVGNPEDRDECVNDSYMALWNSIPPQNPLNLSAYLYKTVRNMSLICVRQKQAQKRGGGEFNLVLDELQECVASNTKVEEQYDAKELAELIRRFVKALPHDERLMFTGRYWLSLPVKTIALRLGVKENRVSVSLHRSREKLRRKLIEEGFI